jgi:excisionase family DNA binding protein
MTFGQKSFTNSLIQNKMEEILKRLEIIEKHVLDQNIILKNVLNFNEACKYLELSQSHLYKLTSAGTIPHYKPNGKKLYFNRAELEEWLLRNRNTTQEEIDKEAANYLIKKGRVKL